MEIIIRVVAFIVVVVATVVCSTIDLPLDYFLISDGPMLKITDNNFNQELILESNTTITAIGNYYDKKYYWAINMSDVQINDYYKGSRFSQSKPWNINSIAVDYLNKKVYVIDELAAKINIFDIKNDRYSIVLSDLKKPSDLTVDCSKSLMFFVQSISEIYRANLDGTHLIKIIEKRGITSITVDQTATPRMLYWAVADGIIETSDYSGSNRKVFLSLNMDISSLAVANNRLVWITPATWTSGEAKLYIYENSEPVRIKNATFKDPRIIQHYVKSQTNITYSNQCDNDNGGCQHLCLLGADKKPSCACQIGWQLNLDLKTCRPIEEFLLYTQGTFIRGKSLDAPEREAFTDAIVPMKLSNYRLRYPVIDFDYDLSAKNFLYIDRAHIFKINVMTYEIPEVWDFSVSSPNLRSLAVDWTTGNVYTINDRYIMVYNHGRHDSSYKTTGFDHLNYRPYSLVVHPSRGYLFFIATSMKDGELFVYRINTDLDSNSMRIIYNEPSFSPVQNSTAKCAVALDYNEDRLYQLCGSTVRHSNLDGEDMQLIDVSVVQNPSSIAIYGEWMYVANSTSIWRLHKLKGSDAVRFAPKYGESFHEPISGVKVYSKYLQKVDYENHPCVFSNEDCEKFCFAVPNDQHKDGKKLKKICACRNDERLQSDGTSCVFRFGGD